MSNPENNPENSQKDRIKFRELLIRERQVADEIIRQYENGGFRSDRLRKKEREYLEEFKKVYTKRKRLQKQILQQDFIEDERIGFGGKGEYILKIPLDKISSSVNKYILKIAKVLQIADNFNK